MAEYLHHLVGDAEVSLFSLVDHACPCCADESSGSAASKACKPTRSAEQYHVGSSCQWSFVFLCELTEIMPWLKSGEEESHERQAPRAAQASKNRRPGHTAMSKAMFHIAMQLQPLVQPPLSIQVCHAPDSSNPLPCHDIILSKKMHVQRFMALCVAFSGSYFGFGSSRHCSPGEM